MENAKNKCLAAVHQSDNAEIANCLRDICEYISHHSSLQENDEKFIRQILVLFKNAENRLKKPLSSNLPGYLDRLRNRVVQCTKTPSEKNISLSDWFDLTGLSDRQFRLVSKTAMTLQLTKGCSHFCRRCNEWALPGVRSHFSYSAACSILNELSTQNNKDIPLYGASDPLDWSDGSRTITDLIRHIEKLNLEYSLLSKVPKGKNEILKQLVKSGSNLSVSVTGKNKERIEKIEQTLDHPLWKQHDLDDLLIPAGLDEDFISVKPSITDGYGTEITPDGAFIIIPTFTSGLHPFGHKKIPIDTETAFFPVKMTGRYGLLVDYFKPLKGYDLNQNQVCLDHLLDVQVESILLDTGQEYLTPPGMTSFKEFLFIFDEPARVRRKKMTPSVLSRLETDFSKEKGSNHSVKFKQSTYYLRYLRHLELCDVEKCKTFKLYALSFFFRSILDWLEKNFLKKKIILRLLKPEISNWQKDPMELAKVTVKETFESPDLNEFQLFRFYISNLLTEKNHGEIEKFVKTFPAGYDPVTDVFINRNDTLSYYL